MSKLKILKSSACLAARALPLLLALNGAATAQQFVPAAMPAPWPRSPFSADEFWRRVSTLLAERGGYVSRERFERALDVKLTRSRQLAPDDVLYLLTHDVDWYMDATLRQEGALSFLEINWHAENFSGPAPQCVAVQQVRDAVTALGWVLGFSARHPVVFDEYHKHGQILGMAFEGGCVSALRFGGDSTARPD